MALKDIPNGVSVVMDEGGKGFTVKFVGTQKDILFLWALLTREVSKKLGAPLSVMAHMVMVDTEVFASMQCKGDSQEALMQALKARIIQAKKEEAA